MLFEETGVETDSVFHKHVFLPENAALEKVCINQLPEFQWHE
jgi:hypothetical protein